MAGSLAFLSFSLADGDTGQPQFIEKAAACTAPLRVDDWSLPDQTPRSDWQKAVQGKIGRCDMMIVLVGPDMAPAVNVASEIQMARHSNVPFFGVYVGGADDKSALPEGLPRNRTVPSDWARIAAAVNQLMHEGKHHVFV